MGWVQGTAVLPAFQLGTGTDAENTKDVVPTPKNFCLRPPSSFGTFFEQICSLVLPGCGIAYSKCSAHLGTGGRRPRGGSDQMGPSPCVDIQPQSMPCHMFLLWRLNCLFQVIFPCSSLYFHCFDAPLHPAPCSVMVCSHL